MSYMNFLKYFTEKNKRKNGDYPVTVPNASIEKKELKKYFSFKINKKKKNFKKEEEEEEEEKEKEKKKNNEQNSESNALPQINIRSPISISNDRNKKIIREQNDSNILLPNKDNKYKWTKNVNIHNEKNEKYAKDMFFKKMNKETDKDYTSYECKNNKASDSYTYKNKKKSSDILEFTDEENLMKLKEYKNKKMKLYNIFFNKKSNKNEKQEILENNYSKQKKEINTRCDQKQDERNAAKNYISRTMLKSNLKQENNVVDVNKKNTEINKTLYVCKRQDHPIFYSNHTTGVKYKTNRSYLIKGLDSKKKKSDDIFTKKNHYKEHEQTHTNIYKNHLHMNKLITPQNKFMYRRSLSGDNTKENDNISINNIPPISASADVTANLKKRNNDEYSVASKCQVVNKTSRFNFFYRSTDKKNPPEESVAPINSTERSNYIKWIQMEQALMHKNGKTYFKDNMANYAMNHNSEFVMRDKFHISPLDSYMKNNNSENCIKTNTNTNDMIRNPRRSISLTNRTAAEIGPQHFMFLKVIGKGSYGKVLLVRYVKNNKLYAMKILRKENISTKSQLEHTKIERNVLKCVVHPFIVKLYYAFQTNRKLYFILEYCPGGELFFHLSKFKEFSEDIVRFYAAEVILALQYLHEMDIIYRDLKPENILLDEQGHIRLTDFGLSKDGIKDNTSAKSLCGTPEYLAPEIISQTGHGKAVDWWSLGIMIFEMLTGTLPFNSSNRKVLFDRITYNELKYPKEISPSAVDLLKKLFEKNPQKRLGSGVTDAAEIKNHPFFSSVNWDDVLQKKIKPPFKPPLFSKNDLQNFDKEFLCMSIRQSDQFDSNTSAKNKKKYMHLHDFNYACEQSS